MLPESAVSSPGEHDGLQLLTKSALKAPAINHLQITLIYRQKCGYLGVISAVIQDNRLWKVKESCQ